MVVLDGADSVRDEHRPVVAEARTAGRMEHADVRERPADHEVVDAVRVEVALEVGPVERVVGVLDHDVVIVADVEGVDELGVVAEGLETIAQPITLLDRPDARPLEVSRGEIGVEDVHHHYGRGAGGLDGVSLRVAPGEKVGLVGRSGAGKSTLVKLLLRFYEPEAGRIVIDGQDIADVTQESLRRRIGMVSQESGLLHRSVRDNILYGRPDATEAEMVRAAQQAQAEAFIRDLTDPEGRSGYDAHVGERGVKLSGGQRQRITLARVILKDAPILLLDEATSALDAESERAVQAAVDGLAEDRTTLIVAHRLATVKKAEPILLLDEATSALDSEVEAAIQDTLYGMMEGKTVIAIAHRLSTIARMDRIIVLDQGHIVEEGSHDALLAQGGLYAGFWARQSGGFLNIEAAE